MPQIIKNKPKKKSLKKTALVPVKSTPSQTRKVKRSPTDYYNCLLNYAQAGFYDSEEGQRLKIHSCCKKCKALAPQMNNQRDKELVKFITSYKQLGDSFAKLLKPLN